MEKSLLFLLYYMEASVGMFPYMYGSGRKPSLTFSRFFQSCLRLPEYLVSVRFSVLFRIIFIGCFVSVTVAVAVFGTVFRRISGAVSGTVFSAVSGITFPVIFSRIIGLISVCFVIFRHLNYLLMKLILRLSEAFCRFLLQEIVSQKVWRLFAKMILLFFPVYIIIILVKRIYPSKIFFT